MLLQAAVDVATEAARQVAGPSVAAGGVTWWMLRSIRAEVRVLARKFDKFVEASAKRDVEMETLRGSVRVVEAKMGRELR